MTRLTGGKPTDSFVFFERFSNGGAFAERSIESTDGLYFLILRGVQQSENGRRSTLTNAIRTEYRVDGDALNRGQTDGLYFLILRGVQQSEKTGGDGSLIEGKPTSRLRRR